MTKWILFSLLYSTYNYCTSSIIFYPILCSCSVQILLSTILSKAWFRRRTWRFQPKLPFFILFFFFRLKLNSLFHFVTQLETQFLSLVITIHFLTLTCVFLINFVIYFKTDRLLLAFRSCQIPISLHFTLCKILLQRLKSNCEFIL